MGTRDDRTVWPSSVGEGTPNASSRRASSRTRWRGARSTSARSRTGRARARVGGPERRRRPRLGLKIPSLSVGYPWKRRPSRWGGISPTTAPCSASSSSTTSTRDRAGYGFIVFADVAVAEMIKAHRQMPFMGKMIDVSEAMRHVGRPDDGRGYAPPYGGLKYGAHGPFYPPQMMYPPHMPMMPGQGPGVPMMFPHPMQFAGYSLSLIHI